MPAAARPSTPAGAAAALRRAALAGAAALTLLLPTGLAAAQEGTPTPGDHAGHDLGRGAPTAAGGAGAHDHGGHDDQGAGGHDGPAVGSTADERAAADRLLRAVRAGVARFADAEAAEAAGYVAATPYSFYGLRAAHFFNPAYGRDGDALDPERPETLMYEKRDDGSLELIGVMFVAPAGQGPAVGGPLTDWHAHPDLCGGRSGLVTKGADGACPAGTFSLDLEMLHVWLIETPGGPFADSPVGEVDVPLVGVGAAHNSLVAGAGLVDVAALTRDVAGLLGLAPEEVGRRYAAGENLLELAADRGVERAALLDLLSRRTVAGLDAAVARDDMTAAQRDLIVRHLPTQVERMVEIRAGEPWVKASS